MDTLSIIFFIVLVLVSGYGFWQARRHRYTERQIRNYGVIASVLLLSVAAWCIASRFTETGVVFGGFGLIAYFLTLSQPDENDKKS